MAILATAFIGFLGGVIGGLFGVGGGLIFVPLLILVRHLNPHLAVGTSLAVIIPTAFIAALRHARAGMIDWRTGLIVALFAMAGSWIGAQISLQLDTLVLRRLLAVFLLALALKMFFPN